MAQIQFNFLPGAGQARWQQALIEARTTSAFQQLEQRLVNEGRTSIAVSYPLADPVTGGPYIEGYRHSTNELFLHPTNLLFVNRTDGTRGPVPDAAILGHALGHLTNDRLSDGYFGIPDAPAIREEIRVVEAYENAISNELGVAGRAPATTMQELLGFLGRTGVPPGSPDLNKCFASGTQITVVGGSSKSIETICSGDLVLAFDPLVEGALVSKRVVRLYENITTEWLELSLADRQSCLV